TQKSKFYPGVDETRPDSACTLPFLPLLLLSRGYLLLPSTSALLRPIQSLHFNLHSPLHKLPRNNLEHLVDARVVPGRDLVAGVGPALIVAEVLSSIGDAAFEGNFALRGVGIDEVSFCTYDVNDDVIANVLLQLE